MKRIFSILFAVVMVLSFSLIPAVPAMAVDPVHNVTQNTYYTTIQAAIDAANSGDTIIVAAGSYEEEVIVDKPLTLLGANAGIPGTGTRGPESIVDADDPDKPTWKAAFYITSGDVTIDGFKTIDADEGIHVACWGDDRENVVIKNNYIDTSEGEPQTPIGASGIIFYNLGTSGDSASIKSVDGSVVQHNYIYQTQTTDGENSIWLQDVEGAVTISGNTVENSDPQCGAGVCMGGSGVYGGNVDLSGTVIKNNVVTYPSIEGGGSAIRLKRFISPTSAMSITGNNLTGSKHGIYITNGSSDTKIQAHVNNLAGNTWGIRSKVSATTVNARANWWGNASGPSDFGPGSGVRVSDYVLYKPWLKKALGKW